MPDASTREQARSLCRQAESSQSELDKVNLAREAQKLWVGCPDAHLVFGKVCGDPRGAREHYNQALSAAYEAIGEQALEEWEGELAHHEHGLSYLRALDSLALVALYSGIYGYQGSEDAAVYLRRILKLDAHDHLGAAHTLLGCLIERCDEEADEEAWGLLEAHPCECSQHLYSRALVAYRLALDEEDAEELLRDAVLLDPYAAMYLLGAFKLPEEPPSATELEEDNRAGAALYAGKAYDSWNATPGALGWLHDCVGACREELVDNVLDTAILEQMFAGASVGTGESADDTIRVLIADSEPVRQVGMKLVLEASRANGPHTFDPVEAETGQKQSYRPEFEVHAMAPDAGSACRAAADLAPDIAIVDVIMRNDATEVDTEEFNGVVIPGGFSLAYNLKHGRDDLGIEPMKVLLLGEYEDSFEPEQQLCYTGADGYVDARVSVGKLVAAVRGVCASEEVRQLV